MSLGNLQSQTMDKLLPRAEGRRLTWLAVIALLLCQAGWSSTFAADEAPPWTAEAERIAALISQLGNDEFTIRETATEELTKIGLPAFAALEAAVKNPDRE